MEQGLRIKMESGREGIIIEREAGYARPTRWKVRWDDGAEEWIDAIATTSEQASAGMGGAPRELGS
jgi:hypothetical protein